MPKRISATLIFAVVIATFVLFMAAEIMAQDEQCPKTEKWCETFKKWTIMLVDGPKKDSRCEVGYLYTYQVCKPGTGPGNSKPCNSKGFNHFNLAIPDCCPNEIQLTKEGNHELKIYNVGAGDPTTKFERGDQFVYVAKFTNAQPQDHRWSLCANTARLSETSVCLKVKNKLECCKILAPGCEDEFQISVEAEDLDWRGYTWCNYWGDPQDPCPTVTYAWPENSDLECKAPFDPDTYDQYLTDVFDVETMVDTVSKKKAIFVGTSNQECSQVYAVYEDLGEGNRACIVRNGKKYCAK
jgi:hypothetical protein